MKQGMQPLAGFWARMLRWSGCFVAVLGFCASGAATADIRETRHNLIRSQDKSVDERAVCVFCHTPSVELGVRSDQSIAEGHPLWQKSISLGFAFTIYDDIGRLGLGKASVGSQSVACMSCHDAVQAFSLGRTSADHPFGVPYRGAIKGRQVAVQPAANEGTGRAAAPFRVAQHLTALEDFRDVSHGVVEGREVWWVSRSGVTARRTRGDLPLYGRPETYGEEDDVDRGVLIPYIECSSCHDPHTNAQSFLRVQNEGSKLCLTCHDK